MHFGKTIQVKPVWFMLQFQYVSHTQCKHFKESARSATIWFLIQLIKLVVHNWHQTRKDIKITCFKMVRENNFRKGTVLLGDEFSCTSIAARRSSGPQLFIAASPDDCFPLMAQFTALQNFHFMCSSLPGHHIGTFSTLTTKVQFLATGECSYMKNLSQLELH